MARASRKSPPSPLEAHLGFWLRFVSNHTYRAFAWYRIALGIVVGLVIFLR